MTHKNIYTAISAVMAEVGYVQKGGKMQYGDKYTYAKESDFIAAVRPALVDHGVVVHPAGVTQLNQDDYATNRGGLMNRDTAIFVYHFHHGESDTGFDVSVLGQGADSGDKSANKAMTAALKYALRQTLLIETGDDPDDTASEPQAASKPAKQQREPAQGNKGPDPSNYIDSSSKSYKEFMALGRELFGDEWDDIRGTTVERETRGRTRSSLELYPSEFASLFQRLCDKKAKGGAS